MSMLGKVSAVLPKAVKSILDGVHNVYTQLSEGRAYKKLSSWFTNARNKKNEDETEKGVELTRLSDSWIELSEESSIDDDDLIVVNLSPEEESENDIYEGGASCEILAKNEVYNLSIPVELHRDRAHAAKNRLREQGFEIHDLGSNELRDNNGLYIYALTNTTDPNAPLTIVCRGTQLDGSIAQDLDPEGPGYSAMYKHNELILSQINDILAKHPNRKIRLTGHSLGGGLSQFLTKSLLEAKLGGEYSEVKNVDSIDTVVFQSAGVSKQVAESAKASIERIKSMEPDFDMRFIAHIKDGDLVPRISGKYLFSDVPSELVDVALIKRKNGRPCLTLGDTFDIGFSAVAGANPLWVGFVAIKNLIARHITNGVEAHGDYFYHSKTKNMMFVEEPGMFGCYRNIDDAGKSTIKFVFEEDLTENIPYSDAIKSTLYANLSRLDNNEVKSLVECSKGGATAAVAVADIASTLPSMSPVRTVVACAKNTGKVSQSIEKISSHVEKGHGAFMSLFRLRSSRAAAGCMSEVGVRGIFPPCGRSRHRESVAPIF